LEEHVMKFNHEAILIPGLHDGMPYTTFLDGLLLGRFMFFLAKSKVTTLVKAL